MVYKWLNNIQSVLFPSRCHLCGASGDQGQDLCAGCRGDLPWLGECCRICALPLIAAGADGVCGRCQLRRPHYDRCSAPFLYQPPLDYLIQRLKFQNDLAMSRLLGQLLTAHILQKETARPDTILPVPLHPSRLQERGFNQSLEIAREVQKALAIPLQVELGRRIRATATQSLLPASKRMANLRNAFAMAKGRPPRHIVLLDDVMTTGATVNELARVAKRAGVKRVDVWVVARVVVG